MGHHQSAKLTRNKRIHKGWLALISSIIIVLAGCDLTTEFEATSSVAIPDAAINSWQQRQDQAALSSAERLHVSTRLFLETPSAERQLALQNSWRQAHSAWLKSSFLVSGLPPESETGSLELRERIDTWPIEPGFFDSLPGYPDSGIVNDETLQIDAQTLRDQHRVTYPLEATLGFHVLEHYAFFRLLEDLQLTPENSRRRDLIRLVNDQLLSDISAFESTDKNISELTAELAVTALTNQSRMIFSEYNLLGEHNRYSDGLVNSQAQLETLRELLDEPVNLKATLASLSPEKATNLRSTLDDITAVMSNKTELTEEENSLALLLMASLSHQFEDFQSMLTRER